MASLAGSRLVPSAVAPTGTTSNNGPVNEGSPATVSITGVTDPSSVDTAAGFHYSFALTSGALRRCRDGGQRQLHVQRQRQLHRLRPGVRQGKRIH